MSPAELRALADRANEVEGNTARRLEQVHARIVRVRRRRQVGAVVAAVIAVILVLVAGTAVATLIQTEPPPTKPPPPAPTGTPQRHDDKAATRELVWAKGSTVHLDHRTVDVGGDVTGIAATDDGAVFTRGNGTCTAREGCFAELWFTDGAEVLHIGRTAGSIVRGYSVEVSSGGSIVVWWEPAPGKGSRYDGAGEYVAYDTRHRREVARMRSDHAPYRTGWPGIEIQAVFDDYVYWTPDVQGKEWCADYVRAGAACRRFRAVMRLDTFTGEQMKVPWSAYVANRLRRPRMFFPVGYAPDYPYNPFPREHPGEEAIQFHLAGDHLVPEYHGGTGAVTVGAGRSERVRLRPPRGYHNDTNVWVMVGWLEDARVILMAENRHDLLVCRLPNGRCRIAVKGVQQVDFGGHG